MFDILPFPNITGETPEEQLEQMNSYLIQLKEELEFILTRISVDNLSEDFRRQLASLGADISTNKTEQEVITQQIINRSISVDDVVDSKALENKLKDVRNDIPTSYMVTANDSDEGIVFETADDGDKILKIEVDTETGYLNYTIQGE